MTPFGASVARELRGALVPIETVSIADYGHLATACRALVLNALFYVEPTPSIGDARASALAQAERLAATIREVGIQPQGISLAVDQARADAIVAFEALIDAVAVATPTLAGRQLGVG